MPECHCHQPYDELIHVPLLAHGPVVPGSRRVDEQRERLDLEPTVFDWHGVDTADLPLEGRYVFEGKERKVIAVDAERNTVPSSPGGGTAMGIFP
jgi:arylsulfatase A-like enzyme